MSEHLIAAVRKSVSALERASLKRASVAADSFVQWAVEKQIFSVALDSGRARCYAQLLTNFRLNTHVFFP